MLRIIIPSREWFNEEKGEFITVGGQAISLEHSLVSLSKWESQFKRPFLEKGPNTVSETIAYIKCMTLTQNVDPNVYLGINNHVISQIEEYISDPMTATWINAAEKASPGRHQVITAEIIYYWMISLGIPFECQKWHLNRLMTLIRVCNVKNQPPKKMGKKALATRNTSLNAARRKAAHSKG